MEKYHWILMLWIVLLGGFFLYAAIPTWTGVETQLKLRPVDPTDLFAGDYMTLFYDVSVFDATLPKDSAFKPGDKIYVQLSGDTVSHAVRYTHTAPDGLYLIGMYEYYGERISYDIDRYYIPENSGKIVDNFRDGNYTAVIKIDSRGNARVEKILKDGVFVEFTYKR